MGARPDIQNEVLCRFTFPERPGALMKFLDSFSPRWNISLFHYRAQVRIRDLQSPNTDTDTGQHTYIDTFDTDNNFKKLNVIISVSVASDQHRH